MFKFTIRDLLWLTVVVALGTGWWVADAQRRREIDRADQYLKASIDFKRKASADANMRIQRMTEELNFSLPPNLSPATNRPSE